MRAFTISADAGTYQFCSEECLEILNSLPRKQFFFKKGVKTFSEAGALDLFSGNFSVARQMVRFGCPWVLTFEWKRGADEDLLDEKVRMQIVVLLRGGCLGAAIICYSFSVAVTPPVRSSAFPRGLPCLTQNMASKVDEGNSHSDFLSLLLQICQEGGIFTGLRAQIPLGFSDWRVMQNIDAPNLNRS